MSWKTINYILGLAAVDQQFWQELKRDPLTVIQNRGFELTFEEQAAFSKIKEETLTEFSRRLLEEIEKESS